MVAKVAAAFVLLTRFLGGINISMREIAHFPLILSLNKEDVPFKSDDMALTVDGRCLAVGD